MISTATSRSPPAPSQPRRRVVRFRALTAIDDAAAKNEIDDSLLPFGIKRVEVGPTRVDVVAFAGNSAAGNSGLLSLALGQAPRAETRDAASPRLGPIRPGRLSSELSSGEVLGATPPPPLFVGPSAKTSAAALTPPRKSDPIQIGDSPLSPSRAQSAAVKPAARDRENNQQRREPNEKDKRIALDATGSWTTRVTFYPVFAAPSAAPAAGSVEVDARATPALGSSQGSDGSGSSSDGGGDETDEGTSSASPKSVFDVRGGRKQRRGEPAKPAAAGTPLPAAVKKGSDDDEGWRLRFRRRWRRERLYAAIGVFPRSPPRDSYGDFDDRRPGADALSAAVAGAFDEADSAVAFGDGEW